MTVTVKKIGGSVAVIIPKAMAADMELADGTPLELSSSGGTITMRKRQPKRRPRRPVSKIAAQINPASYRRRNREMGDDDRPVGREVW